LASIGIIKGQPFNPTGQQQALLKKAVETAPKMILAARHLGRPDGRQLYYKDRRYQNIWAGATSDWLQDSYLDVDERAAYFQIAYASAPAMVMRTLDAGSKYPFTTQDADGNFLNGSNTYKLHLRGCCRGRNRCRWPGALSPPRRCRPAPDRGRSSSVESGHRAHRPIYGCLGTA